MMSRMLSGSRTFWISHQKPADASSRLFCSPRSVASSERPRRSQKAAGQAALSLSRKDWLATLAPPPCQQQEEEEKDDIAPLTGPIISGVLDAEGPLITSPNALVIGIDPDVSGAMAVLDGNDTTTAEVFDVPSLRILVGSQHRRRHDTRSIVSMIRSLNAPTGSVAYIEQSIPLPKDGKQGWWGSGFGYGIWIGTLVASGISVVPVPSSTWKRAMGLTGKTAITKDDCRACASYMFPSLASQLRRKKDHGRAEALLIAAHGKGLSAPVKDSLIELSLHGAPCRNR